MSELKDPDSEEFQPAMNTEDFRHWGKYMVDYICDYLNNIEERRVIPDVEPGYLRPLMPEKAPEKPESWPEIFKDVEDLIMPGITHWQHPRFHAYFPAGNSFPSIMGDMLSDALGTIGFSWAASPAMAELEIVVVDWLADLLGLPKAFTFEGTGGGALQGSASDCILVSMLAARHQAIGKHNQYFEQAGHANPETAILSRLVAYCSNLAHSSIEKAGMISFVRVRQMPVDDNFSMQTDALQLAIEEDIKQGYIPFYICATMGTTACCSFDDLKCIGPIAEQYGIWLHIDGAYGANSFICPEFRGHLEGIEYASSINFNPNKWLLTNFDCSVLWVADRGALTHSMVVNPIYLQHKYSSKAIDFRHWGIPLSRRFRALKLWFVIRKYGATGLRAYIRSHVRLAKLFASLVESDDRFEVIGQVELGLVCFRIRGANALTQCLIRTINESRELHMVPAMVNELYIIRFAVCRENANEEDIRHAWNITKCFAEEIIAAEACLRQWRVHTHENSIRKKRRAKAAATALQLGENGEVREYEVIERVPSVPEVNEEEEESEVDDDDDGLSTCSSNLGDLEITDLRDEDIIQLATERLQDLHEQGAKEAYNVLAQQLRNLGSTDVRNYEDLSNSVLQEKETAEEKPCNPVELPASPPKEEIQESKSNEDAPVSETGGLEEEDDEIGELGENNTPKARVGRFKSLSVAMALKGYDRVLSDRRTSQPGHSDYLANSSTTNPPEVEQPNVDWNASDISFLDASLDTNRLSPDVVSSTPFVNPPPPRTSKCKLMPRQSMYGVSQNVPSPPRRFSLNPEVSILGHNASCTSSTGGTPVVARLVSMVMNASGNGPMNVSYNRQHRLSMRANSMLDEVNKDGVSGATTTNGPMLQNLSSVDVLNNNRLLNKLNNTYSHPYRVGMNLDEDTDDVFVSDHDLCVGGLCKESTLTRLRRQTLLKMISDPISYKNRRNFRSVREQRRMTAVSHDFEPCERPKSEYIRRPTVQICENIHKVMENGGDELLRDFKRRNKSMTETSSLSMPTDSSSSTSTSTNNNNNNPSAGSVTAASGMKLHGYKNTSLLNEISQIQEECEGDE